MRVLTAFSFAKVGKSLAKKNIFFVEVCGSFPSNLFLIVMQTPHITVGKKIQRSVPKYESVN